MANLLHGSEVSRKSSQLIPIFEFLLSTRAHQLLIGAYQVSQHKDQSETALVFYFLETGNL